MDLRLYAIALPVFFAIDMVWLGLVAKNFYASQIGSLLKTEVNWAAAIIFYLLFIAGMVVFVIEPGMKNGVNGELIARAAFFGLVTYATYDLTNLATLKSWPLLVTIVDLAWGTILSVAVSSITLTIAKLIKM